MRVLFVDDEPDCIQLGARALRKFLPNEAIDIRPAKDCSDALLLLEAQVPPFDVAIIDQRLPKVSGLECLRLIRDRYKELPIVVITGLSPDEGLAPEAFKAMADDYVSKNSDEEVLPRIVWSAIGRRKGWVNAALNQAARVNQIDQMGLQNKELEDHLKREADIQRETEERLVLMETSIEKFEGLLLSSKGGIVQQLTVLKRQLKLTANQKTALILGIVTALSGIIIALIQVNK